MYTKEITNEMICLLEQNKQKLSLMEKVRFQLIKAYVKTNESLKEEHKEFFKKLSMKHNINYFNIAYNEVNRKESEADMKRLFSELDEIVLKLKSENALV